MSTDHSSMELLPFPCRPVPAVLGTSHSLCRRALQCLAVAPHRATPDPENR